jgi:hypothetical protein
MSTTATCGGAPINGVVAVALGTGISLTLVRSERGFCFFAWSRHDGQALPLLSDEHRTRAFATVEEAVTYFRTLVPSLAQ